MDTFIQLTLNGFTLGSVYALIALGYRSSTGSSSSSTSPTAKCHGGRLRGRAHLLTGIVAGGLAA